MNPDRTLGAAPRFDHRLFDGGATSLDQPVPCPICLSARFELEFERYGYKFVRCVGCDLLMINPQPSWDALKDFYASGGAAARYAAKRESKMRRARREVRRVARYRPAGRWLDCGCSAGFTVLAAKEAGYASYGLDLEPFGIAYARETLGLADVEVGTIEDSCFPDHFFDVISMYDIIEHVRDPSAVIGTVARLLTPDGVLALGTPDVGHWRTPRPLPRWSSVKPAHLFYFTQNTLTRLLALHGFAIQKRRFSLKPGLHVVAARKHR